MRYFTTQGRLNRWRYFLNIILPSIFCSVGVQLYVYGDPDVSGLGATIVIVGAVVIIFPAIRRLHDLNASGWWYVLSLVPIANFVLGLILLFVRGTEGENRYGSDPLQSNKPQDEGKIVDHDTASSSSSSRPRQKTHTRRTMPRKSTHGGFDPDEHEKKCPDCAEYIKLEARVCRYCRHQFSDEEVERQMDEVKNGVREETRDAEAEPPDNSLPQETSSSGTVERFLDVVGLVVIILMIALLLAVVLMSS